MSILVLVAFGILAVLGVPLSLSLGLGCAFTLWYYGLPMSMITQTMATSINSFLLIAVPLFVLAGNIMERGGLSERIFAAADAVVGRFCGGLGHVNILSSFVFGGISGSSVADVASLGPITIRSMTTRGYPVTYAAALTLITSTLATLVPPSILIIVAAAASGESVGKALAGGLGPGILLALALFGYNYWVARSRNYGIKSRYVVAAQLRAILRALPSLGAPVIILTGMFSGIVTPTEAAGLAVIYTMVVGMLVHRDLGLSNTSSSRNARRRYRIASRRIERGERARLDQLGAAGATLERLESRCPRQTGSRPMPATSSTFPSPSTRRQRSRRAASSPSPRSPRAPGSSEGRPYGVTRGGSTRTRSADCACGTDAGAPRQACVSNSSPGRNGARPVGVAAERRPRARRGRDDR